MSIILTTEAGWVLDQEKFLNLNLKTVNDNGSFKSFVLNPNLFNINSQFLRPNQKETSSDGIKKRKRKICQTEFNSDSFYDRLNETVLLVKTNLSLIIDLAKKLGYFKDLFDSHKDQNTSAKLFANEFYDKTSDLNFLHTKGGNNSNEFLLIDINSEKYIIPPKCNFYSYDIRELQKHLPDSSNYDLILLDPPWWNKYIRRKKMQKSNLSYTMIENFELLNIPIETLLKPGGIVTVWCTNASSHLKYIEDALFPKWNLTKEAAWFWIKVTKDGKPVCEFSKPLDKQPFEQLIFGRIKSDLNIDKSYYKVIPDNKIIASVPSALHSHKPNLTEIISQFLPENAKCLELFARSLQSNWTSYGFEPLRLQHVSLFQEILK